MKERIQQTQDWNERYLTENTPWRHEIAHSQLLELIEKYTPENAAILEIGCGTGEEAIALAEMGYKVLAIDIAPAAIKIAESNAIRHHSKAKFQVVDFINDHQQLPKFATICDVACMHTFADAAHRIKFAAAVAAHLDTNGIWINLSCAKPAIERVAKITGVDAPPGLTLMEIAEASVKHFNLIEMAAAAIPVQREEKPVTQFPVWISVFQKL